VGSCGSLSPLPFFFSPLKGIVGNANDTSVREKAAQLLAADSSTLAPAALANKMVLIQNVFTASENSALADLTLANFDGSTPLDCGLGTQPEGLDPNTNDAVISLKTPAGGWRWETTGVTNLPQTIHGYALLDNALALVLALERLPTPITLTAINQMVNLGQASIIQLAGSMR